MGREYPLGFDYFKTRLKAAFMKKQHLTESEDIEKAIKHGEYIVKELEALYFLKKYREMKRRYYDIKRLLQIVPKRTSFFVLLAFSSSL